MFRFVLRRILLMVPTLFAISILSFLIIQASPGDFIDTYVANGKAAYKFDGSVWSRVFKVTNEIGEQVQYFVNDKKGGVTAIYRIQGGELRLASLKEDQWEPWTLKEPIKGRRPLAVTSAAFDSRETLWIGLGYLDRENEVQPFGAVSVARSTGEVLYHRNFQGRGRPKPGSLSLPNDITGIASIGADLWVSTTSGACRVRPGQRVRCFTEGSGLGSDLVRGAVMGPNYAVWFATVEGVFTYNGRKFTKREEEGLDRRARAIAVTKGGRVWVATNEGLVLYHRGASFTYDDETGLLEDKVLHLRADAHGRLWAQHPGGISMIKAP